MPLAERSRRPGAILTVDLDAIAANWRQLRRMVGPKINVAAVVKADGYGLGLTTVGPVLAKAGCTQFFVATLDEGLALRKALPRHAIVVLEGVLKDGVGDFARAKLIPALNDAGQIATWRARQPGKPAILHIDTGMERLGLSRRELDAFVDDTETQKRLNLVTIMSHLACSDEPHHPKNPEQLARFRAALARLPKLPASFSSSSAIFLGSEYLFDIVRPGAALVGINPIPGQPNPMRPVIGLKSRILQVRDVDAGETVGYGATHRMQWPSRIATIAVGYADGWLRSASDKGSAAIAGQRAPVVGRISMDLVTLDVTGIDAARPGAYVDLLDKTFTIDDAADAAGTIGYELMCLLGKRYERIYRGRP